MDAGQFMSIFGDLPYMNPFMSLNLSGLCATTKIIQCSMLGVNSVEVSAKFRKNPKDVPDLDAATFKSRKAVLDEVQKWCESMKGKPELIPKNTWSLINYHYEIVKSSATRLRDWSHMLFIDYTLRRFLIVLVLEEDGCKCGNPFHDDYATLAKHHAHRMFCLAKYLHWDQDCKPAWVRATYVTPSKKLPPTFLDEIVAPPPITRATSTKYAPVIHVDADTYKPSLSVDELEKIDNLRAMAKGSLKPVPKDAPVRKQVLMPTDQDGNLKEPPTNSAWLMGDVETQRECAHCHEVKPSMPQCARCKLVRYCGPPCQRAAWKTHKLVCKAKDD